MTPLHGSRNTETLQTIPAPPTNKAVANFGRGLRNTEKSCTPGAGRGRWQASHLTLSCWIVCVILVVLFLAGSVDASHSGPRYGRRSRLGGAIRHHEEILLDHSPAPIPIYGILEKRRDEPSGSDQRSPSPSLERPSFASTAVAADETETARPSLVSPSDETPSTTAGLDSPSTLSSSIPMETGPLPKPFDGGLGTNYTQQSCPKFLRSMLSNDTFSACLPLSLLLQNSVSFFKASRSRDQIDQTLAATCNVVFPACSALMASFAQQLRSRENCEQDWQRQNHLVTQAYNGLVAYEPLHNAGCLKDIDQRFCFSNAITNTASPSDSYVYYLPVGIPLPGASKPSCTKCLSKTMNIFQEAASNRSQPVTSNYVDAAQMIDITCGPTFVNSSLPLAVASGKSVGTPSSLPIPWSVSAFCVAFGLVILHFTMLA